MSYHKLMGSCRVEWSR